MQIINSEDLPEVGSGNTFTPQDHLIDQLLIDNQNLIEPNKNNHSILGFNINKKVIAYMKSNNIPQITILQGDQIVSEQQLNTSLQVHSLALCKQGSNRFIIIFSARENENEKYQIYQSFYNYLGNVEHENFLVYSDNYDKINPQCEPGQQNRFVIAWESYHIDQSLNRGIYSINLRQQTYSLPIIQGLINKISNYDSEDQYNISLTNINDFYIVISWEGKGDYYDNNQYYSAESFEDGSYFTSQGEINDGNLAQNTKPFFNFLRYYNSKYQPQNQYRSIIEAFSKDSLTQEKLNFYNVGVTTIDQRLMLYYNTSDKLLRFHIYITDFTDSQIAQYTEVQYFISTQFIKFPYILEYQSPYLAEKFFILGKIDNGSVLSKTVGLVFNNVDGSYQQQSDWYQINNLKTQFVSKFQIITASGAMLGILQALNSGIYYTEYYIGWDSTTYLSCYVDNCEVCRDYSCDICTGSTPFWRSVRRRNVSNCDCQTGYQEVIDQQDCSVQCSIPCSTCEFYPTQCLTCQNISTRFDYPPCKCLDTYYEDYPNCLPCEFPCYTCESQNICLSCVPQDLRHQTVPCQCKSGSYENSSQVCVKCVYPCLTCQSATFCESCVGPNQVLNDLNQCVCDNLSFNNPLTNQCTVCQYPCIRCISVTECLSCYEQLQEPSAEYQCQCIEQYYLDEQTNKCKECNSRCQTCKDPTKCLTCIPSITTQRDISLNCFCPQGFTEDLTTKECIVFNIAANMGSGNTFTSQDYLVEKSIIVDTDFQLPNSNNYSMVGEFDEGRVAVSYINQDNKPIVQFIIGGKIVSAQPPQPLSSLIVTSLSSCQIDKSKLLIVYSAKQTESDDLNIYISSLDYDGVIYYTDFLVDDSFQDQMNPKCINSQTNHIFLIAFESENQYQPDIIEIRGRNVKVSNNSINPTLIGSKIILSPYPLGQQKDIDLCLIGAIQPFQIMVSWVGIGDFYYTPQTKYLTAQFFEANQFSGQSDTGNLADNTKPFFRFLTYKNNEYTPQTQYRSILDAFLRDFDTGDRNHFFNVRITKAFSQSFLLCYNTSDMLFRWHLYSLDFTDPDLTLYSEVVKSVSTTTQTLGEMKVYKNQVIFLILKQYDGISTSTLTQAIPLKINADNTYSEMIPWFQINDLTTEYRSPYVFSSSSADTVGILQVNQNGIFYSEFYNKEIQSCSMSHCDVCYIHNNQEECSVCKGSNPFWRSVRFRESNNDCFCNTGYSHLEIDFDCNVQCVPPCSSCEFYPTQCTTCISSSNREAPPSCACLPTFYEDNNFCQQCQDPCINCSLIDRCLTCVPVALRPEGQDCLCQLGYYENSDSECTKCVYPCLTCVSEDKCLTCVETNQILNSDSKCVCDDLSFLNVDTQQCEQCQYPCVQCLSVLMCKSCKEEQMILTELFQCQCPESYYFDEVNQQCSQCQGKCLACLNSSSCLTCKPTNPEREINNKCNCPIGYKDSDDFSRCIQVIEEQPVEEVVEPVVVESPLSELHIILIVTGAGVLLITAAITIFCIKKKKYKIDKYDQRPNLRSSQKSREKQRQKENNQYEIQENYDFNVNSPTIHENDEYNKSNDFNINNNTQNRQNQRLNSHISNNSMQQNRKKTKNITQSTFRPSLDTSNQLNQQMQQTAQTNQTFKTRQLNTRNTIRLNQQY